MLAAALIKAPVRLVFTMGWDPFQLLINVSTKSAAAHVAIGLGEQGEYLLHAYEPGIVLEPRDEYLQNKEQKLVAEYAVLPDVSAGLGDAMKQIGKRGFWQGATQIGIARALQMAGSPIQHLIPSNERTCARFAMLLDRNGERIPEWRGVRRRMVVPGDLLQAAETGPSFSQLS